MSIQLKLYPPKPIGLEAALGELHPVPSINGNPIVIGISDSMELAVLQFLKDGKVRFKVLDSDGSVREWSPDRHDWVESVWDG